MSYVLQQTKAFKKTMKEFNNYSLKDSYGRMVTTSFQAYAIAYSLANKELKSKNK